MLHAGPLQMGILGFSQFLPGLLLSLPAGVWLDRRRRRPVMVATQLLSMVALATIPAAAVGGVLSLPQLYAVGLVTGAATTVYTIAQQAFFPGLAGRENLVEANAKYQTSFQVASLAGPGLAGYLVQLLTAPIAIAFDAVSFLAGAATAAWIRTPEPAPAPRSGDRRLAREARDGVALLIQHPLLRSITLTIVFANLGGRISGSVFVLLFVGHLGITPAQLGLYFAAGSVSALLGAQLTRPLIARGGLGPVMVIGAVLFAAGFTLNAPAALAPRPLIFPIMVVASLVAGFGLMAYNINQQAIRGTVTPNAMLGRANAGLFVLFSGGQVIGSLVGGALGQTIGLFWTLVVACAVSSAAALPALFSPLRQLRELPALE